MYYWIVMTSQRSFNYKFKNDNDEFNFFVNKTNFYAFSTLTQTKSNFLFLFGPKKSGKTFLSQLWLKKNNAILLNDNYKLFYDNHRNIVIDDILLFQEEKIFHIVNNCILNNLKILITSNIKINEIEFKFNDLSSRLKTFLNLEIEKPNDEMLLTILTKLLVEKQFIIKTNDIFEFILRRVDRTYLGIHDTVSKLDVLSLEKKRQLTIPLIKEIL